MKILLLPSYYCSPEYAIKGVFFRDQAQALLQAGHGVDVLFYEARSLRELSPVGLCQSHWQTQFRVDNGLWLMHVRGWNPGVASTLGGRIWSRLTLHSFARYLKKRGRPDVIHAHNSLWAGHAAALIQQRYGIPYVLTEHSSAFRTDALPAGAEAIIRRAGDQAAARIAVSSALAQSFAPHLSKPVLVIPNVVDTDFFRPPEVAQHKDGFTFLAVGNLLEMKGFHLLLEAFAARFAGQQSVRLHIAGEGPERQRLMQLVARLGIASQVQLLGLLSRDQVRMAMSAADAFIHPSFQETFGVVLIEAMAAGLPVVATRCGGPEEILRPDCGILIAPRDLPALAQALVDVRQRSWNPTLIREHAVSRFSPGVIAAALTRVYENVLNFS